MNLKGGYKILNLLTLVLVASVDGTTGTDITDVNTLEQLDSLKEYLDASKQLKPILLRVKPSKEKVVMAELSRIDDVTLMIHAKLDGYELNIVVSYEQDEETLLWYIDEAQYLYVKTVNSEVGIKGLISEGIQADKDILSQIVYDEENELWHLPPNILPLRLYGLINAQEELYGNLFFDYENGLILNEQKETVGSVVNTGNIVDLTLESDNVFKDLTYIHFDGEDAETILNTYYLYHPVTSAGTKLYLHSLRGSSGSGPALWQLCIINTSNLEFEVSDFGIAQQGGKFNANNIIKVVQGSTIRGYLCVKYGYSGGTGNIVMYINSSGELTTLNLTTNLVSLTDTVTEL